MGIIFHCFVVHQSKNKEKLILTTIYFIRHAEPDFSNHNDMERPLTQKGMDDSKLVTKYLSDKNIDIVLSSPYMRAISTVKDYADLSGHSITTVEGFRERKVDSVWIEDFNKFSEMQWNDFDYKLSDGECLREVQNRNIDALMQVLREYRDKNIIIGSHGTSLSTVINYFKPECGLDYFQRIRHFMPWIVKLSFDGEELLHIEEIDVFQLKRSRKAIGAIVITPENKYLLVHKAKVTDCKDGKMEIGLWDFIKGGVRENETVQEAIIREIHEETGLKEFVVKEELIDNICFEFPPNLKLSCGYDAQETTMFIVQLNELPTDLRCIDDEIDGYEFVDKDNVLNILSLSETKEFWNRIIKKL